MSDHELEKNPLFNLETYMQQLSHDLDCYASCLHRRDAETYSRLRQGQVIQRKNTVPLPVVHSPWGTAGRFPATNGQPSFIPSPVNSTMRASRPFGVPGVPVKMEHPGAYPTFPVPPTFPFPHVNPITGGDHVSGDSGATIKNENSEPDIIVYE